MIGILPWQRHQHRHLVHRLATIRPVLSAAALCSTSSLVCSLADPSTTPSISVYIDGPFPFFLFPSVLQKNRAWFMSWHYPPSTRLGCRNLCSGP
jgi:hypothetical protein